MRHSHGIQHAVLGVVSCNPEGIHGYAARAELAWLDEVAKRLQDRYGASASA
ncbi:MAG: hypothetical protein IT293_17695 [Deltaproteobacteria bacterium]|nr:hypothetical protein [Deltaproteobacteria bacterium]